MHVWGAVDLRIYLAQKYHDYSISAQSYDFCPRLIKLDILGFTLPHIGNIGNVGNMKPIQVAASIAVSAACFEIGIALAS